MKWCQVRVFVVTWIGVLAGNLVAHRLGWQPVGPVLVLGALAWGAANLLNAAIAARSSTACEPILAGREQVD